MTITPDLRVTSHVGRDLLAAAAVFKTEAAVVWEYVVNSLQYVDRGVTPRVQVNVEPRNRRITISDNGRGMNAADLTHFFQVHGENPDRMAGRGGRGKFGTGKSAVFGIGNVLVVDTTKDGLRNVVRLTRNMIEASRGEEIPTDWQVRAEPTQSPNGTTIVLEDIVVPQIRTAPIVDYIERHLQAFRARSPEVAVNSHVCESHEPEIDREYAFKPSPSQAAMLGDVELFIKISRAPLPDAEQGVVITAGPGNLVARERTGIEGKEFGNYLFGQIDVPAIEESDSPIEPYDSTRSLQLNPQHPVVAVLLGFVGGKLEEVRGELVRRSKEARKTEQMRRLAEEAEQIANILNEDFRAVRKRLDDIRTASARPGSATASFGELQERGDETDSWVRGTSRPGNISKSGTGREGLGGSGRRSPDIVSRGEPNPEGLGSVDPAGGAGRPKGRPRGGFAVEYRNLGRSEERSRYDPAVLTILINLDHPVVTAALGEGNVADPGFRRLSYEIAFTEYSMGLGYEILKHDPNVPGDDLLYEVRSTLNRIAASAAALYR